MKLRIPKETYKKCWARFMDKYGDKADLETKLSKAMEIYTAHPELSKNEKALTMLRKYEAQKIANDCKDFLIPEKEALERIEAGKASLGYTTQQQEISAMREMVERFEFTAICLAIFKKKYCLD